MTTTPGVAINYALVQGELHHLEMEVWRLRFKLLDVTAATVYLTPMPPVRPCEAALMEAHERIGHLRMALRDAEKEGT